MERLNFEKNNLRKFATTMGIAFLVMSALLVFNHKRNILPFAIISAGFFVLSFTFPLILKPVYFIWMKLAFILSWINTRLILIIIFYLIFTPIRMLMRLFGKDLLELKIEKNTSTYWKKKDKGNLGLNNYEKQF
jgi:hypothetical protein